MKGFLKKPKNIALCTLVSLVIGTNIGSYIRTTLIMEDNMNLGMNYKSAVEETRKVNKINKNYASHFKGKLSIRGVLYQPGTYHLFVKPGEELGYLIQPPEEEK